MPHKKISSQTKEIILVSILVGITTAIFHSLTNDIFHMNYLSGEIFDLIFIVLATLVWWRLDKVFSMFKSSVSPFMINSFRRQQSHKNSKFMSILSNYLLWKRFKLCPEKDIHCDSSKCKSCPNGFQFKE